MNCEEIIKKLRGLGKQRNIEGMERFGIYPKDEKLGVSMPDVRNVGKEIKRFFVATQNDRGLHNATQNGMGLHKLASELWLSKIHEARILASVIDLPEMLSEQQMDKWVKDFDSWDLCDQVCMNLFSAVPFAFEKAKQWTASNQEFVRRGGFALMASLAVHDKKAKDSQFIELFPFIIKHSNDERNFVRKAVNWALRQIGKRNLNLNRQAIKIAIQIQALDNKTAKWIANDALRELKSEAVQKRLK